MVETGKPARTHAAFTVQKVGKKLGRWLEIGSGRIDPDGVHLFLDRLPIGGFTGYVRLIPHGTEPPVPELSPRRPTLATVDDDDTDEGI